MRAGASQIGAVGSARIDFEDGDGVHRPLLLLLLLLLLRARAEDDFRRGRRTSGDCRAFARDAGAVGENCLIDVL